MKLILWYSKKDKWIFNRVDIRTSFTSFAFNSAYSGNKTPQLKLLDYVDQDNSPDMWNSKPKRLLKQVIKASSNIILDPFCGIGTTLDAAHKLEHSCNRNYHLPTNRAYCQMTTMNYR